MISEVSVPQQSDTTADTVKIDSSLIVDSVSQEIDFAEVFDSTADSCIDSSLLSDQPHPIDDSTVVSLRYPPYKVIKRPVRIVLQRNLISANFYTDGRLAVKTATTKFEITRGSFSISCTNKGGIAIQCLSGSRELSLPCTLIAENPSNLIKVQQNRYRDLIVLISEKSGTFSVVNHIDVEQYLRGVVPLEIGKRSEALIESLKAQAVAARTYTYKRMAERRKAPFDMTATVQDQVYGGADVEYRESDMAIKLTADLILVFGDSLVQAYYHSTCGGKTANIEDVWDKPQCGYLRSINDIDSVGRPYCRISPRFNWTEKWPSRDFFAATRMNLEKMYPGKGGALSAISVKALFSCGRVKTCSFTGNGWNLDLGGDKLRFIIRRPDDGNSILRSANFKILSMDSKEIVISGVGYGHGVGMCQMGAIGRAECGQTFDTILKAYYSGVTICTAVP